MKTDRFYFTLIIFIILSSCAKPTVVNVKMSNDSNLNCEELEKEYQETRRFKKEAIAAQNSVGGNTTRAMLFWPALLKTMHNADTKEISAEIIKLNKLYKKGILSKEEFDQAKKKVLK